MRPWLAPLAALVPFLAGCAASTSSSTVTGMELRSQMSDVAMITSGSGITQNYSFSLHDKADGAWNREASDNVEFTAYANSDCTTASTGTFTMAVNPMPTTQGRAELIGFGFILPSTTEGSFYVGGKAKTNSLTACSKEFKALHPWRKLIGYTLFTNGGTGAGGATAASQLDQARAIQVDSSGKRWAFGTTAKSGGGTALAVWRYHSSGEIDSSFGTSGAQVIATTGAAGATGASQNESIVAAFMDSSSKTTLVGSSVGTSGEKKAMLWRIGSDGLPDSTFGSSGVLTFSGTTGAAGATGASLQDNVYSAIALTGSSGGFLVGGSSANAAGAIEAVVWRLSSSGAIVSLVTTGTPSATGTTGASIRESVQRALDDGSGGYWMVGTSRNSALGTELVVWKRDASLVLQSSYGISNTGIWRSNLLGAAGATGSTLLESVGDASLDADKNLVVIGSSKSNDGSTRMALWRFLKATGAIDTSFGSGRGIVVTGATGAAGATSTNVVDQGLALRVDSSGKIWVAGSSKNASGGTAAIVWRFQSDGSTDQSFGSSGVLPLTGTTGFAGATAANLADVLSVHHTDSAERWMLGGRSLNTSNGSELWLLRLQGNKVVGASTSGALDK